MNQYTSTLLKYPTLLESYVTLALFLVANPEFEPVPQGYKSLHLYKEPKKLKKNILKLTINTQIPSTKVIPPQQRNKYPYIFLNQNENAKTANTTSKPIRNVLCKPPML